MSDSSSEAANANTMVKRHRDEQFAFQSLQRHQRQEHDDDDGDPGGDGRDDFFHRDEDDMQMRYVIPLAAEMADDVFHDHDRCIHQHADGDSQTAQRHQVGGHAELLHQDEGDEHR